MNNNIHQVWEKNIYGNGGQFNLYPDQNVIPFLLSIPSKERRNLSVLEVGCGTGNNLWMGSKEGFEVTGIDISETAIEFARKRFEFENLKGDFHIGNCSSLKWDNETFDMVIDRSAITCNSYEDAVIILREVKRVMKKNGKMRSVIYSDKYTTINGNKISRNSYENFKTGMFVGHGTVLMLGEKDLNDIMKESGFEIISYKLHNEINSNNEIVHSYWVVDLKN